jgi:C4-dicarboxylate-specific signal transduction histidine kinase
MVNFKFSPDILSRLGEELLPNPDQGIMELVKNSYDADATECTVQLIDTDTIGGTIIVSDNGVGMNLSSITDGWLVIGRSKKADHKPTKLGRLPVGDKGLGRLAALRQGSHITLKTRPVAEVGWEYSLHIDWDSFSKAKVVEDVSLNCEKNETHYPQGTDTIIQNLSFRFGKREVQRLARELLLLADPFDSETGFRPKLISSDFNELEKLVQNAYFSDAEYKLEAYLNDEGEASARLTDWKGETIAEADHKTLSKTEDRYQSVSAKLEIWFFVLQPQSFTRRERIGTTTEIRNWLEVFGGVHLYHREIRVKPYGDFGNDWLGINLLRSRDPEFRPSTGTTIGRVTTTDPYDFLIQKTDRLGLIENKAFSELRKFSVDSLDWVRNFRLKESEKKREQVKRDIGQNVEEAKVEVERTISALDIPSESRTQVLRVIQNYEKIKQNETKSLQEDILLYRSLATAGTTAALFAHESDKPVTLIEKATKRIAKQGQKLLAEKYAKSIGEAVDILQRSTQSLRSFAKFPLHLLKRAKRKSTTVDVHEVIDGVITLFSPFLEESKVAVKKSFSNKLPLVRGNVALLEAILVNLVTNSLNSFNFNTSSELQRQIMISTKLLSSHLEMRFLDNGSGIVGLELDEIWLPGRSTTPGGTGLGLTITKDSVTDLGGRITAIPNGELGGAEFLILLPLVERV